MKTTFIYGLNDPETGECRYVGKADRPKTRLQRHLVRSTGNDHRANWLRSLAASGLRPELEILQEVPESEWPFWERVWINVSRKIGMNLTNFLNGGEGCEGGEKHPHFGRKQTPEEIENRAAKQRGPLSAWYGKTGEQSFWWGRKHTEAAKQKMRLARLGTKHTKETRDKMRASHLGELNACFGKRCSVKTRLKISRAKRRA